MTDEDMSWMTRTFDEPQTVLKRFQIPAPKQVRVPRSILRRPQIRFLAGTHKKQDSHWHAWRIFVVWPARALESELVTISGHQRIANMASTSLPSRLDGSPKRNQYNRGASTMPTSYSTNSKSIPIHSASRQSREESDLRFQQRLAEERDHSMFLRIVNGMMSRQGNNDSVSSNRSCQSETDKSIASIMRTRYKKLNHESSVEDSFAYNEQPYLREQRLPNDDRGPPDAIFIIDLE